MFCGSLCENNKLHGNTACGRRKKANSHHSYNIIIQRAVFVNIYDEIRGENRGECRYFDENEKRCLSQENGEKKQGLAHRDAEALFICAISSVDKNKKYFISFALCVDIHPG